MKKRHNAIVDRVKKACGERWAVIGENRVVGTENRRPDLVIQKINDIIIN